MELEKQVCSFELAKRLKELNVKQDGLVHWLNVQDLVHMKEDENGMVIIDKIEYRIELGNPAIYNIDKDNRWSAFTASELGEIIISALPNQNVAFPYYIPNKGWGVWALTKFVVLGKTEADAKAKYLINIIEQRLIKND